METYTKTFVGRSAADVEIQARALEALRGMPQRLRSSVQVKSDRARCGSLDKGEWILTVEYQRTWRKQAA